MSDAKAKLVSSLRGRKSESQKKDRRGIKRRKQYGAWRIIKPHRALQNRAKRTSHTKRLLRSTRQMVSDQHAKRYIYIVNACDQHVQRCAPAMLQQWPNNALTMLHHCLCACLCLFIVRTPSYGILPLANSSHIVTPNAHTSENSPKRWDVIESGGIHLTVGDNVGDESGKMCDHVWKIKTGKGAGREREIVCVTARREVLDRQTRERPVTRRSVDAQQKQRDRRVGHERNRKDEDVPARRNVSFIVQ